MSLNEKEKIDLLQKGWIDKAIEKKKNQKEGEAKTVKEAFKGLVKSAFTNALIILVESSIIFFLCKHFIKVDVAMLQVVGCLLVFRIAARTLNKNN